MSYYGDHIQEYIDSTINSDMAASYAMFEPYVPNGGSILDVGFGSARDMLHFDRRGYEVFGIDAEQGFVEHALSLGLSAKRCDLLEFATERRFDGIWACASLLHLEPEEFPKAINRLLSFLKPNGILFISMKKGQGETVDEKGRRILFANEESFAKYNPQEILETYEKGRGVHWINVVIKNGKM